MLKKFRLIPVVMLCTALLLGYKVIHLAGGLEELTAISPAHASSHAAAEAPTGHDSEAKEAPAAPVQQAPQPAAAPVNPAEMALLGSLSSRREELDRRSKDLDTREQLLAAAQKRMEERVTELKALETKLNARIGDNDKENEARVAGVVQLYENMKPKDAARIFERLDMGVLIDLAKRMSPRKLAPVMAVMDPVVAQDLTVELATGEKLDAPEAKNSKPATPQSASAAGAEPVAATAAAASVPAEPEQKPQTQGQPG